MGRLEAFVKLIQSNITLVVVIFLLLCSGFYFTFSGKSEPYAALDLPQSLAEQIKSSDLNLQEQWRDPEFVKQSIIKLQKLESIELAKTATLTWESLINSLQFNSSKEGLNVKLFNYPFELGSKVLEAQLASLVEVNSANIKERQEIELGQLKTLLKKIDEQIVTWNLELKSAEEGLLKSELSEDLAQLQKLASTYALKHPLVQDVLGEIKIKYQQMGRKMPEYEDLLENHILDTSSSSTTTAIISNLKNQLAEANQKKLTFEEQIALYSNSNFQFQLPKAYLANVNQFWFWSLKVFLPSLVVLLFFLAIAYKVFRQKDPVLGVQDLKSAIKVEKVYSFPQIDLRKSGSRIQKNPVNGNILLIAGEQGLTKPSNLPAIINKQSLPVPVLSNSIENQVAQNQINELAAKIMINAKAANKKILFFSAPQESINQTVVVSNLAVAMAKYSSKVLMLDASFGSFELSRQFELDKEPFGFSEYLCRTQKIANCLHLSWLDNLYIMPIGQEQEGAQKLLLKPRFTQALTSLVNRFDYILISAGSLATDVSSQMVASNSDLIFLVTNDQSNTLAVIREALVRLSDINLQPEAVILQK